MDQWESIAERKIREAFEAGAFDNLPSKGQPIPLDRNPFEDPTEWMAHHLLQVNGFAPAWIEEARDIDAQSSRLREKLADRSGAGFQEFRARATDLNQRILTYNLKCPSAQFHKRLIDIEREIRSALSAPR